MWRCCGAGGAVEDQTDDGIIGPIPGATSVQTHRHLARGPTDHVHADGLLEQPEQRSLDPPRVCTGKKIATICPAAFCVNRL